MKTEPNMVKSTKTEEQKLEEYTLKISRLTIDKLGVKLYDKVSAVIAELIANSFDADAEKVEVRLPLNTALCTKKADGSLDEKGFEIEIKDDGHGMTPAEAQKFYLFVGKDRRNDPERAGGGSRSRVKNRPVMGRKGIGKLAPFGVCKRIEVVSAGGENADGKGFLVSHFFLDYEKIVSDTDANVLLDTGDLNNTYATESGTTIRLSNFAVKTVPDRDTFHRQIATRFIFARPDFEVLVEDTTKNEIMPVKSSQVDCVPETKIDLSTKPVITDDGKILPVKGWLAMAKESYKNQELAGVRIYARDKIVGQTRDFEQPAGFTGEFTVRSYLVGEIEADWLDLDDGEDLIRSDRQGILWESDYGRALKKWGAELIKEIGRISKEPRRRKSSDSFMKKSDFAERAKERFANQSVVDVAVKLAEQIGAFAAGDELEDDDYINGLSEVILTVAPHKALIDAFQEFNKAVDEGEQSVERLVDLFDKTRIAEMASYARIAAERVEAINKLQHIVITEPKESEFQKLLADAPWLIEPTWSVISENEALSTTKTLLEKYIKTEFGTDVVFAVGFEDFSRKRPDFSLASIDGKLYIVEIKPSGHAFDDLDFERLANYPIAFGNFFAANEEVRQAFPKGWQIKIIADGRNLRDSRSLIAFDGLVDKGVVVPVTWTDFLMKAKTTHEKFMKVAKVAKKPSI